MLLGPPYANTAARPRQRCRRMAICAILSRIGVSQRAYSCVIRLRSTAPGVGLARPECFASATSQPRLRQDMTRLMGAKPESPLESAGHSARVTSRTRIWMDSGQEAAGLRRMVSPGPLGTAGRLQGAGRTFERRSEIHPGQAWFRTKLKCPLESMIGCFRVLSEGQFAGLRADVLW
jgi:hypothetical protein